MSEKEKEGGDKIEQRPGEAEPVDIGGDRCIVDGRLRRFWR